MGLLDTLLDLELNSETSHSSTDVESLYFPTVHPTDCEPVTVLGINTDNGPWIAGGACLRWYQGLPVGQSDIDVFCRSLKQFDEVVDRVRSYGRYHRKHDSENAATFEYWDKNSETRWTIQIIKKRFYENMQEIIDNFDVSVCQIATNGNTWVLGNHTARDIREKNLRMRLPLQPDAVKRLTKYWIYGYRPVDGLLDEIKNNPIGRWEFNPSEDYS